MGFNLPDSLRPDFLTKIVERFALDEGNLLASKVAPILNIKGDVAQWTTIENARDLGEFRAMDAPFKARKMGKVIDQTSRVLYADFKKPIPESVMAYFNSGDKTGFENAVGREQKGLWNDVLRLWEYTVWQMHTGTLAVNQADLKVTVDYKIPAGNKPVCPATWATDTTDIVTHLKTWRKVCRDACGMNPDKMYVGANIMSYLLHNTSVKNFLGEQAYRETVGKTGVIPMFMGMTITEVESVYDASGTVTGVVGDDSLILTAGSDYATTHVGEARIRRGDELATVAGRFSYATAVDDPPSIMLFTGMHFLPVLEKPENVIYVADVTP